MGRKKSLSSYSDDDGDISIDHEETLRSSGRPSVFDRLSSKTSDEPERSNGRSYDRKSPERRYSVDSVERKTSVEAPIQVKSSKGKKIDQVQKQPKEDIKKSVP